jgi:hypothetical protein
VQLPFTIPAGLDGVDLHFQAVPHPALGRWAVVV